MPLSSADIHKFLSSIQPFRELSSEDLRKVSSVAKEHLFKKGETIFNEGETADSVWVLQEGRIQIFKYTSEAKPFAIESLASGELFGTLCRLGGNGRDYPCTAVAATPISVLRILDRTFLEYYMKSPGLVRGVCSLCSQRLKDVQDLRCMGQESAPVRIGSILLRLYEVHGQTLPFTKKEISELSGTTIETTFRTLSRFQKAGLVASLRGKIQIQKPDRIKNLLQKA